MASFFIIDHSLKSAGGHHFDYAHCVAEAAADLGFQAIVGTHRKFKPELWDGDSFGGSSDADSQNPIKNVGNEAVTAALRGRQPGAGRGDKQACCVTPVFRKTTYQRDSYLAGLQHLTRSHCGKALVDESQLGWTAKLQHQTRFLLHRRRREWFVRQFAADCARFFERHPQRPGDHAFLTTISELELMGLALYLARHPESLHTHWHLQFHYNLFDGRTPEYASQGHLKDAISACFLASLSRLSYHSLSFYTTSSTLAEQYNRLNVGTFSPLPYPIASHFQLKGKSADFGKRKRTVGQSQSIDSATSVLKFPLSHDSIANRTHSDTSDSLGEHRDEGESPTQGEQNIPRVFQFSDYTTAADETFSDLNSNVASERTGPLVRPLRFTCPGGIRREKGQSNYLQTLVNEVWPTHLSTGKVQLVVQRPKRKFLKAQKLDLELPTDPAEAASAVSPVEYVNHPLPQSGYVDLVHGTDVGLLYYDSRVYFSRRAGVLGELLACGKPVIVSAGSWLSDQIEESNFAHVDRLLSAELLVEQKTLGDLDWKPDNIPLPGGVVSFDRNRHPFEFSFKRAAGATAAVFEFDWHWPKENGVYCRVEMVELDAAGNEVGLQSRVVGVRNRNAKTNSVMMLSPDTVNVRCRLSNAYDDSTASIRRLSVSSLALDEQTPTGSVGLVAADEHDLVRCVDEMVTHYDHYRSSVEAFATRWYANHDPKLTVSHMLSVEQSFRKVA